jgi:hypothetical protein
MNKKYEKKAENRISRMRGFLLADNVLNKRMFYFPTRLNV